MDLPKMSDEEARKFVELIAEFERASPMKVQRVTSEEEYAAVVKEHETAGRRLACVSNTGLPEGHFRLTFLPNSAFERTIRDEPQRAANGAPKCRHEPRHIDEWLKELQSEDAALSAPSDTPESAGVAGEAANG